MDLKFEKRVWKKGDNFVIGLDEAGRGPLAGPVFAGAVCIIQKAKGKNQNESLKFKNLLRKVKDSKQFSFQQRERIYKELVDNPLIIWAEGRVGPKMIDKINILLTILLN